MPRRARERTLYDGCYAHVYSRALEKRNIYHDHEDFLVFKRMLIRTKLKSGYRVHHYCLMNTHFHLVVSVQSREAFSQGLRELKQGYAKWYHKKYAKQGPVWWGRFGSQLIESEKYMYACGLYVEMNPVKAGIVARPEDWEYSSSRYYFLNQRDDLVDNYARPEHIRAEVLLEGLNMCRGSFIGTPLFIMNRGKELYQ